MNPFGECVLPTFLSAQIACVELQLATIQAFDTPVCFRGPPLTGRLEHTQFSYDSTSVYVSSKNARPRISPEP
jgi:hypothetical protein